jgi:hypothetical protein
MSAANSPGIGLADACLAVLGKFDLSADPHSANPIWGRDERRPWDRWSRNDPSQSHAASDSREKKNLSETGNEREDRTNFLNTRGGELAALRR